VTEDRPEDCTCPDCQSACQSKPGWFLPGEAEGAAALLGVSLAELFRTKLAVDWWEAGDGTDDDVFVVAPALVGHPAGEEYPGDPRGRCVFYVKGRCQIHAAKPHECAMAHHDVPPTGEVRARHRRVAMAWRDRQPQVAELLGREPEAAGYGSFAGLLGSIFGEVEP
jgi:Fe-S-cluster containining protein